MTDPAPGRLPTTFMSRRGLNPTTKLIIIGTVLASLVAIFYLGRAAMMMQEQGQDPAATVPAQMPALPPPIPASASSVKSAAPATPALQPESAASAEAADQPIHAAPELAQTSAISALAPAKPATPTGELPSFQKPELDLSRGEALLDDVRDNTFGVDEGAFYWLVEAVNKLPASRFASEPPEKQVTIGKLCEFPRTYRGRPVTLSLVVGKVEKFGLPLTHATGIKGLWVVEAYQTPFVGEAPVCEIILTEDPGQIEPRTPFLVRGYFYKVRSYDKLHADGDIWIHQSPLIVAKTIEISTPVTEISGKISGLTIVGVIALIVICFVFMRRILAARAAMPALQPKRELTADEIAARVEYLKHEETAPPQAQADEEIDPIEQARRRDEALAKFEEQARKKK